MMVPRLLLCVLCLASLCADAKLTDEEISTFGGCYFARVTAAPLWRMRDQDGLIREFEPFRGSADTLISHAGWSAKIGKDGTVTVRSHPAIEPRLVFTFKNGTLTHLNADGRDCNFKYPNPIVYDDGKIVPLWPEDALTKNEIDEQMSSQWNFGSRWAFGFASPNQAGAVLATLVLICLAVALKCTGIAGRVFFSALSVISFVLVVLTASRGALVAIAAGVLPLLACFARKRLGAEKIASHGRRFFCSPKTRIALLLGLAILAAYGVFVSQKLSSDRRGGDSLRLELLRAAPRMLCDAPGGWGSRSDVGKAYTDWYQPKTSPRRMLSLVSDQLTNVVALGWFKGGAYVFVWIAGLLALWIVAWRGGTAIPAVAWTALGVAAAFNVVLHTRYVSWLPIATLPLLIQERCLRNLKFWIWPCAIGLAGAVLVTGGMICAGKLVTIDAPRVTRISGGTVVNGQTSSNWLVADPDVLGLVTVKKEVRNFYEQMPKAPAIVYTEDLDAVPFKKADRLVLTGRHCSRFLEEYHAGKITQLPREIVFLAPPFGSSKVPIKLRAQCRAQIVIGEFAARYYEDYAHPPKWVTLVRGAEVYIPVWMRFCAGRF